jgi:diguanylate cyclase (GGDEF)-like protein
MQPIQSDQLTTLITRFAIMISIITGLTLPIGYALISYHNLSDSLLFKAKIKAHAQNEIITALPNTWMFAENRTNGVLSREPVALDNEYIEVFDNDEELVTSAGAEIEGINLQRSYPLYDINKVVGKVTVKASLQDLLVNVLWSVIFGGVLAGLIYFILRSLPIKALQRISTELYTEKERAETTLHAISEAVILIDAKGVIIYSNVLATIMLGDKLEGQLASTLLKIKDQTTGLTIESALFKALRLGVMAKCNKRSILETPLNQKISIEERASPLFDKQGKISGVVLCLRDVTIARANLERQTWEASHDLLTGLVNRREFERRVSNAIDKTNKDETQYVVCCMDLDRFKVVNDSCGHAAGDELLKQLSNIMSSQLRSSDTLARLGGDEFGLLLEDCDQMQGERIAKDLLKAVEQHQFFWEKEIYTVGISIGLTLINTESFSILDVLGQADSACYWAKEQGRHRICTFNESDVELVERRTQTGLVARINAALKDDRFTIYHQNYRALKEEYGACLHLEILLRMIDEEGEIVPPDQFIPAAERYDLMPQIDRWVINKVFSEFQTLKSLSPTQTVMININLSGASINSLNLYKFIQNKIVEFNIDPESICFEITETVAVKHITSAIEFINKCKGLGIKFAIDDFGAGASSFEYLKKLPVNYLKIDGGFVKNLETNPIDRAMVETINRIGHIMEKITIAEFAENQPIIDILTEMEVDFAQGYGISYPIPLLPRDSN